MASPCDVPVGVITGDNVAKLLQHAKDNSYAIPAFNCTSSSVANAAMESASKFNCPVIIQASHGGSQFFEGKSIEDKSACAAGAVSLAVHVRTMAPYYGIPIILHSDQCAKKLSPWFEELLKANENFFAQYGEPLFSSHMIDLSEEPDDENIAICVQYFKRMAPMKIWIEMKIGITGREGSVVDNSDGDQDMHYISPEQAWNVYKALSPISEMFSIAAAFGNVHGFNKPGNGKLSSERLVKQQEYVKAQLGAKCITDKPIYFVVHGGSGSAGEEIQSAVKAGVIKMSVDTDTQWAYWDGVRRFLTENHDYLHSRVENPQGEGVPNDNCDDSRAWIRKGEESMIERCGVCMEKLGCAGTFPAKKPASGSIPMLDGFAVDRKKPVEGVIEKFGRMIFRAK